MRYLVASLVFMFTLITSTLSIAATRVVPDGFELYYVQVGDTQSSLQLSEDQWRHLLRINQIDGLYSGQSVLIPRTAVALTYVPVPRTYNVGAPRGVVTFLDEQLLGVYVRGRLVYWSAVSTGKRDYTPTGRWKILSQERMHYSFKYKNAPMPFSQRYWGNYFLHEGRLPGVPASMGCVRILAGDAEQVFDLLEIGDVVIVTSHM